MNKTVLDLEESKKSTIFSLIDKKFIDDKKAEIKANFDKELEIRITEAFNKNKYLVTNPKSNSSTKNNYVRENSSYSLSNKQVKFDLIDNSIFNKLDSTKEENQANLFEILNADVDELNEKINFQERMLGAKRSEIYSIHHFNCYFK